MFQADAAFALELIALAMGALLFAHNHKENAPCQITIKFISYFVIIASILAMICTFYFTLRYWKDGYFNSVTQEEQQTVTKLQSRP